MKNGPEPLCKAKVGQAVSFCFWLFIVATALITFGYSFWALTYGEAEAIAGIQAIKPWLAAWRIIYYSALIGAWPLWVGLFASWAELPPENQQVLLKARWHVCGVLVLYELLIVQNSLAGFFP
ncbi:MAG: hypothetical protein ABL903_09030 [Methylococcales bacterium]